MARKLRSNVKELVLYDKQFLAERDEVRFDREGGAQPDMAVELIDITVSAYPRIRFVDALSSNESRRPVVPSSSVNLVKSNHPLSLPILRARCVYPLPSISKEDRQSRGSQERGLE